MRALMLALAGVAVAASVALGSASAQAAQAPTNTQPPTISGTPREGQTLTGTTGTWTGDAPITFAFQWVRCDANDCRDIAGATNSTYTVTAADNGNALRFRVRATNAAGTNTAQSEPVAVTAANAPANTAPPTISGTPQEGQTLTANPGTWTGAAPIAFAFQWLRCNQAGETCAAIAGATGQNYAVSSADVGTTLRVNVTASNSAGTAAAPSGPTAVVTQGGPEGQIRLPGGGISIPVTSVSLPARLVVSGVQFSPNPVRSRNQTITARFRVTDTRGFVVRDAIVFVRATPLVTSTPPEQQTGQDGWVSFELEPRASFPLGLAVQFFVRARKQGEPLLAGVSTRRLVQVRTGG